MQDEAECLFFLADLHALTADVDAAQLGANIREMAAALIASGIDPAKSILFRQSAIPAHAELAWILQGTALCANRIDLAGSMPLAINAAAMSRMLARRSSGSICSDRECRSARKYRHWASSCIRTQRRIAPSRLPR
jgi:hypothetical protein